MVWNIASAKQRFSEVVRLSAQEPQLVYNRQHAVAAVLDVQTYREFQLWRQARQADAMTPAQRLAQGRQLLSEAGDDGLPLPERADRGNAWLDEEPPCN